MKIQVNTDANVAGHARLVAHVSTTIEHALARFKDQVTRVEVHLSDENAAKTGPQDQRCLLEARLEGRPPLAVTDHGATQEQALIGATQKLQRLLDSTLGRLGAQRDKAVLPPTVETDADQPE